VAVKVDVEPEQTLEGLAYAVSNLGVGYTVTYTVCVAPTHPAELSVGVTEYNTICAVSLILYR
jgi:hypothetical protein